MTDPIDKEPEGGSSCLSVANVAIVSPTATTTTATAGTAPPPTTTTTTASTASMGSIPIQTIHHQDTSSQSQQGQATQQSSSLSERRLDFIGTSRVVKNLFSLPYSNDRPLCVAVHNLEGTLLIDTANDTMAENDEEMTDTTTNGYQDRLGYIHSNHSKTQEEEESSNPLSSISTSRSLALALVSSSSSPSTSPKENDAISLLSQLIRQEKQQEEKRLLESNATASAAKFASSSSSLPPNPPREYLEWKFHGMNLLVGSDAIIVRPPDHQAAPSTRPSTANTTTTALAIRVEETSHLRQLLERQSEMIQDGRFVPDHQLNKLRQQGKPSYAQAVGQQQQILEESKIDVQDHDGQDTEEQGDVSCSGGASFAAPNLDKVRLQTCIVPTTGPLGGLLSQGPESTTRRTGGSHGTTQSPSINQASSSSSSSSAPISIVLDAYLDNVIANVPQLALCLREKGFIQSVKLLETNEIPSMFLHESTLDTSLPFQHVIQGNTTAAPMTKNRQDEEIFSPEIMEMNASALLRFLQSNCSRDNATYLLRREAGEANIQLFDISSISTQRQRKWSWWLATMSYRFALRLRHLELSLLANQQQEKQQDAQLRRFRDRQRSLYQTTLDLLDDLADMDGRAHESLVASVNENMADTFLGPPTMGTDSRKDADRSEQETNKKSSLVPPTTQEQQQPYGNIPIDGLNKAQDHLMDGIKSLWPVLEKTMEEVQHRKDDRRRRRRRRPRQTRQVLQRVTTAREGTASSGSDDDYLHSAPSSDTGVGPSLSSFLPSEAIIMQLFGLHQKLINVSLRLAEHHLRNYFSSSAMQALRTAARRMADSGSLLHLLHQVTTCENDGYFKSTKKSLLTSQHGEQFRGLQLQYAWLWEHCGHFARSFASDELWRERGHACGDDVISVLRDVEAAFAERDLLLTAGFFDNDDVGDDDDAVTFDWYRFSNAGDPLSKKTQGSVSLNSLSAVVDPQVLAATATVSEAARTASAEFVSEATSVLGKQRQLQRDKRQVLVASCVSYNRAIRAFEAMLYPDVNESPTGKKLHSPIDAGSAAFGDDAVDLGPPVLRLLRQRLGDSYNETGKVLLAALRSLLSSLPNTDVAPKSVPLAAEGLLSSAQFWFLEGLEAFKGCQDLRNLALLRCNLCQCFKLRANSSFASQKAKDGSSHAEFCLQEAANHLQAAHEDLGQRDVDPMTWDMVSEELAATFLVLGVRRRQSLIGGGNTPVLSPALRLTPGKERSIVDPMERALKIYEQSGNGHQAAAVHYQLALTNSKIWTCQRDEAKTREKLSAAFQHYNMAFSYFSTSLRNNEPTFVLLCLDLASLYAAVSGEECLTKALSRCLDTHEAFSQSAIDSATSRNRTAGIEWFEKMETLASSVEDRVFKLLRSLVKLDSTTSSRYKDLYRVGLTAKMVENATDDDADISCARATKLLALHDVLLSIQKKLNE